MSIHPFDPWFVPVNNLSLQQINLDERYSYMTPEDLRAAVAAGIISEAQAASVTALVNDRAGKRAAMPAEDEPFEFFKGFSEIFVSLGLIILMAGIGGFVSLATGPAVLIALPAFVAATAWWFATYFTLKRRMNLPSMVLASAFGLGLFISALTVLGQADVAPRMVLVGAAVVAMIGMAVWYRKFRLPFAMFVLGMFALTAIYAVTASFAALQGFSDLSLSGGVFDLRNSPQFALATLAFGIAAFAAGMWFDTRDPYRLGRHAATGFWLHLMAAPALVNTVALTLFNIGGTAGMASMAVALTIIALLALVIDRRSFLTAGIVYIALVIAWIIQGGGDGDFGQWVTIILILGATITALGTWWVPLRAAVMRTLPAFPGKTRLPPYASAS
jgi:hypothetical protein